MDNVNYTSLQEPVTKQDIAALQQQGVAIPKNPTIGAKNFFLIVGFLTFIGIIFFGLPSFNNELATVAVWAGLGLLPLGIAKAHVLHRKDRDILTQSAKLLKFTRSNGMLFQSGETHTVPYGAASFSSGNRQRVMYSITPSANSPVEMGVYEVQYRNSSRILFASWSYLKIDLGRPMPHMMLTSIVNDQKIFGKTIVSLPISTVGSHVVALNGGFEDTFRVYAAPECADTALAFFTPQLLSALRDDTYHFYLELVDQTVYIYVRDVALTAPGLLQRLFRIAASL